MTNRTTFVLALGAFVAPLLAPAVTAQQPQQQPQQQQQQQPQTQAPPDRNSVQVGVPQGRDGGQGRQGGRGALGGVGTGRAAGPPRPAPRNAEGRVLLGGATIKDKGVWIGGGIGRRDEALQPWARAIVADRNRHQLEPHTRCKASGVSRPFMTPYGVEIVELPELKRIYIFDIGGPHTFRTIYMDG